ncbi:unnamed protein product, partial [Mesorhabditis belari]|uniref:Uncharacterized protein n=1 Tax=Mesorhabditis belari TaxID=2138241 RepID=A0AAF3FGL9_9BILA
MIRPFHSSLFLLSFLVLNIESCCDEEKQLKQTLGNRLDELRFQPSFTNQQQIRIPEDVLRMLAQYDSMRNEQQSPLTRMSRANGKPTFIRFGKRSKPTFIRFGKRSSFKNAEDQWIDGSM